MHKNILKIKFISATHLQNQCYLMCFRRASGFCQICFSPRTTGANAAINQGSFGLSWVSLTPENLSFMPVFKIDIRKVIF